MSEAGSPSTSQSRDPLLDREHEVARLDVFLRGGLAGNSGVVLVEGPAGIGKTRLLFEARRSAQGSGFRVLSARGGVLEQEFPFGVVCQLFEPGLVDEETRERALRGAAAAAGSVLGWPRQTDEVADDPSFAYLHALYWLTVNLSSDRPLLLAVDDLQWCDRPSLRFLAYLVRRLERLAVLVMCGMRRSEAAAEPVVLGEIAGDPLTVSVRPRPLSPVAAAELIRSRLRDDPDEAFTTACHRATGGNPLLLHELVKVLDDEDIRPETASVGVVADLGPRAVARVVQTRLARLPEAAVRVARSVAVLGAGADLATVAVLAGLGEEEARAGAAALMRIEVLQADSSLAFVHPLVGAAVYDTMSPPERQLQHQQAASLLGSRGAQDELVAAHLLPVGPRGEAWVVDTLRRAASLALRKGAAESAVSYLTRALDEPPPPGQRLHVLRELGSAESLTNGPSALAHLREAYELSEDPLERAGIVQRLSRALVFTGQEARAAALARSTAAELPDGLQDHKSALEALELLALFLGGGDSGALDRLADYRDRPMGDGLGAKMLATVAAWVWPYFGGSSEACASTVLAALADGELVEADNGFVAMSAISTLAQADREEAVEAWQASLAEAHRRGSLAEKACISWGLGVTMLRRGELAEAEDWIRTASEEVRVWLTGSEPGRRFCTAYVAMVLMERGELSEARRALPQAADSGDRSIGARLVLYAELELLVAEDRFEEALTVAAELSRRFAHLRNPVDTPWHAGAAVALDGLGRWTEALGMAHDNLALARQWGAPGTVARALRVLGTIERVDGLDRLHEAVDVVAGSPARLEHAKALAALGTALRRMRRRREARDPLRRALELADVCGAKGLVDHVRSELYAVGARPRSTAIAGVRALTPTELRVANLAAQGRSNRGIAQALYVTPKTVEVHLTNAYRKLGIRARHQLAAELGAT